MPHTRSAQDVALFRQVAPSVVLILTKDASGSGSLLQGGVVLTSLHVLDHNRDVRSSSNPLTLMEGQLRTRLSQATL